MSLIIDRQKCLACGICAEFCILDNLRVETSPCRAACPMGVNPQAYVTLLSLDRPEDALGMIYRDAPFPRILGHVCQAPCEKKCTRRQLDGEVAIRDLKRFLAGSARHPQSPYRPGEATGKKVAIVGAGPAGLMAAIELRRLGHGATVFDALPEAGGMMLAGIPRFHLPDQVRRADLGIVRDLGIEARYGVRIGRDISLEKLRADFDAVLLAVGTHLSERLNIQGEDLRGVRDGISFLREVNLGGRPEVGKRVLVIGGGNVALDSARVVLRLGAQSVEVVSLEARDQLPAFESEVKGALEEGVALNCGWGPERFLGREGRIEAVELKKCLSVLGAAGRFQPTYDPERRMTLPADTVIVAAGQAPDLSFLLGQETGDLFQGQGLKVNPETLSTRLAGVFAAGDLVTGPSSVVQAMASGRKAARGLDLFLRDQDPIRHRVLREKPLLPARPDLAGVERRPRQSCLRLPLEERKCTFRVIDQVLEPAAAREEAGRCLRCAKAVEYYQECWYCLPCEVECPTRALTLEIPFLVN